MQFCVLKVKILPMCSIESFYFCNVCFWFWGLWNIASEQIEENTDSIDDNSLSSGIQETTPDQGHTLPILQKIIDLSTKVQVNFGYSLIRHLVDE